MRYSKRGYQKYPSKWGTVFLQLELNWALNSISGFLKKQKIHLFLLHADCCEQAAAVGFKCEPQFKIWISLVYFQGRGLQTAPTAPAAQLHHMQAQRQPKILDCPLSAGGRSKKGKGTRLKGIARDTMQTLIVEAGSPRYPRPVCLVPYDCPVKVV